MPEVTLVFWPTQGSLGRGRPSQHPHTKFTLSPTWTPRPARAESFGSRRQRARAAREFCMANKMIIDASHPEETRVVVLRGNRVEEFDFESASKRPLRGNIYLAKVTRVEPSLQAAFVDYGGNRHGFLAFSEIHPDYYQIPVADRQALLEEEALSHRDDDEEPSTERRSRRHRRHRNVEAEARSAAHDSVSEPASIDRDSDETSARPTAETGDSETPAGAPSWEMSEADESDAAAEAGVTKDEATSRAVPAASRTDEHQAPTVEPDMADADAPETAAVSRISDFGSRDADDSSDAFPPNRQLWTKRRAMATIRRSRPLRTAPRLPSPRARIGMAKMRANLSSNSEAMRWKRCRGVRTGFVGSTRFKRSSSDARFCLSRWSRKSEATRARR